METKTNIIRNKEQLDRLIEACEKTGYASVDFETNAKPIYTKDFIPTILSVSFMPGFGSSIILGHKKAKLYCDYSKDWISILKYFGHRIIENRKITKVAWNAKFDFQIFELYDIYYRGVLLDGMLAKYVLDENRPNGLKDMVRRYMPELGNYEKQDKFDKIPWDDKPLKPLCHYGAQDTDYTLRLTLFFERKMIKLNMYSLYRNLIMPASRVLLKVEKNGLYVDTKFNKELLETYKPKIDKARLTCLNLPAVKHFQMQYNRKKVDNYITSLQEDINFLKKDRNKLDPEKQKKNISSYNRKIKSREEKISRIVAGEFTTKKENDLIRPINLNSNTDLPLLLYSDEGFKLKPPKLNRNSGKPSTDEESLNNLRLKIKNPKSPKAVFLDNLLSLRGLEKMYKTYILGWSEKVQDDSCLHGRLLIHGTTSGRLSSQEPNIQQIPKTSVDPNIKKQLLAKPGKLYLVMDFSQAELRIMAHLSGDETYLQAFKEGQDPHLAVAAKKYGVPYKEAKKIKDDENHPDHQLWSVRRKQAKQIAFGIIYGIQAKLLSKKLSDPKAGIIVTPEEAQQQLDEFFQLHPKIKVFMNKQKRVLEKNGYVKSLFGRKRRLPEVYSDDMAEAAYAQRLAVNFPCQSAASDMCLFGSILLYWKMRQGKFPYMDSVCLVHDANYFNANPKDINIYTVYQMWNIYRNPSTKKYFGFSIDDVDMSMDFEIGTSMAGELPFIPLYDYNKLFDKDWSEEKYLEESKKYKDIDIKDYPKYFKKEMKEYENRYKTN